MADTDAAGVSTRRRRATFATRRGGSLMPMNGSSTAACESTGARDLSGDKKSRGSPETARFEAKSEKDKRRKDKPSDMLR